MYFYAPAHRRFARRKSPSTCEHRCTRVAEPYRASISFRNFVYSVSTAECVWYELSHSFLEPLRGCGTWMRKCRGKTCAQINQ